MCGFCSDPATGSVVVGENISIPISPADQPNDPHYRTLAATSGHVYRVRVWPDGDIHILALIIDPSGKAIRRYNTGSGETINPANFTEASQSIAELEAIKADCEYGCKGDTHVDILFKAELTGEYKVGAAQLTTSVKTRSQFQPGDAGDHAYTLQWRAKRVPPGSTAPAPLDLGQLGAYSMMGVPVSGNLKMLVEHVTQPLPPLQPRAQKAMEDLRVSVHMPRDIWNPSDHPCLWGASYAGLNPTCCIRGDGATISSIAVTTVSTNLWLHAHRGTMHPGSFRGSLPNSIVDVTTLRGLVLGPSHISGTLPAGLGTLPLIKFGIDNTLNTGNIPSLSYPGLTSVSLKNLVRVSGTLPSSISLADPVGLWASSMRAVSGTLPSMCGQRRMRIMVYRHMHVSGTIPETPHMGHPMLTTSPGLCASPRAMGCFFLQDMPLSGTLSPAVWCTTDGKASLARSMVVGASAMVALSGTMPPCMFKGASRLTGWTASVQQLAGSIPLLNESTLLYVLRFDGNQFASFPPALPPGLRTFMADNNPNLRGSADEVAKMLTSAPKLDDFSLLVDKTLQNAWHRTIDDLPFLSYSSLVPPTPLTCTIGEECSFTLFLVVWIDYVPLTSIGVDWEVRLSPTATLPSSRRQMDDMGAGTAYFVDRSNFTNSTTANQQPVQTAIAEHLKTLNLSAPMVDTNDGLAHFTFPREWTPTAGRYEFRIFGKRRYCHESDGTHTPCGNLTKRGIRCSCRTQLLDLAVQQLWHVDMLPIQCLGATASSDDKGSTCQCAPGYAPAHPPCILADRGCECLPCSSLGSTLYSPDGMLCQECPSGSLANRNATGCECQPGRYNVSMGTITCVDQNFKGNEWQNSNLYTVARSQAAVGLECVVCPICVSCLQQPMLVQPGFNLAPKKGAALNPNVPQDKTFLRCRPETAHTDGLGSDGSAFDASAMQCLGGELKVGGVECLTGHTGPLCGECAENYGRQNVNQCVSCKDIIDPWDILQLILVGIACTFVTGLIMIALSFVIGDVYTQSAGADTSNAFQNPMASQVEYQIFEELDEDGSGSLDQTEIQELMKRIGKPLSAGELRDAMAEMDKDQSGSVDVLEFRSWLHKQNKSKVTRVISGSTIFKTSKRVLVSGASMSIQPLKLFISYWQIAAHMGAVLHFQFPPMLATLFAWFKPLVVNIQGVVALECAGLRGFYSIWFVEVLIIPAFAWLCVLLYYFYRRTVVSVAEANMKGVNDAFLVLFLTYPFITNKLFGVLNCRTLDDDLDVLVSDYSVDCDTDKHHSLETLSYILVFLFSFSVPVAMIIVMDQSRHRKDLQFTTPAWKYITRRVMAQLSLNDLREVKASIIDTTLGLRYGSLVIAFKPGFFYWEMCDMLRKLFLVGVLSAVDRGSTVQVCAGLAFSFAFFAAHIKTMPYRHAEDNFLKATTEAHLFIVMVMVLVFKGDLKGEALEAGDYDAIVTYLFVLCVPISAAICIIRKWHVVVKHDIESAADTTHTDRLITAFNRQRLGKDKDEDRQLLAAYYSKMEQEVNNDFHVFISYRVASEAAFAKALYEELSELTLSATQQNLRVYLDQVRLEDGARWDVGFMSGLSASWIAVPIVSTAAVEPMLTLNKDDEGGNPTVDNVLMEWIAALEMHARGDLQAIIPIIACDDEGNAFSFSLPKSLSNREHAATAAACRKHLLKLPSSQELASESDLLTRTAAVVADVCSDDTHGQVTVSGVLQAILRYQGILLSDRSDMSACTQRIFGAIERILGRGDDGDGDGDDTVEDVALPSSPSSSSARSTRRTKDTEGEAALLPTE
jgi:hypothetical protein